MARFREPAAFRLVAVESPFAGDTRKHLRYVRACLADCLRRGEAPVASHALLTQPGVLRDHIPAERVQGINAGLAWAAKADARVVYTDCGMSSGMRGGIAHAESLGQPVEYRTIAGWKP